MKKSWLVILMFVLVLFFNSIADAQSKSMDSIHEDMHRAMLNDNLQKLSELLGEMADVLARGNMEPSHEAKCAEILMQVSHIMMEMTGPPEKETYEKHKNEIQQIEKEWNPWKEMVEH